MNEPETPWAERTCEILMAPNDPSKIVCARGKNGVGHYGFVLVPGERLSLIHLADSLSPGIEVIHITDWDEFQECGCGTGELASVEQSLGVAASLAALKQDAQSRAKAQGLDWSLLTPEQRRVFLFPRDAT